MSLLPSVLAHLGQFICHKFFVFGFECDTIHYALILEKIAFSLKAKHSVAPLSTQWHFIISHSDKTYR